MGSDVSSIEADDDDAQVDPDESNFLYDDDDSDDSDDNGGDEDEWPESHSIYNNPVAHGDNDVASIVNLHSSMSVPNGGEAFEDTDGKALVSQLSAGTGNIFAGATGEICRRAYWVRRLPVSKRSHW